jgi:hypothetical protein
MPTGGVICKSYDKNPEQNAPDAGLPRDAKDSCRVSFAPGMPERSAATSVRVQRIDPPHAETPAMLGRV